MQKILHNFFNKQGIYKQNTRFLLAVSGGVDSMVLARLFILAKLDFAVVHCNFQLRATAADEDENFVKNHFEALQIPVFTTRFDTSTYAKKQKIGIQEAARNLRYTFFQKIAQQFDYQYIITAHHANDNVETMLFNLASGAGLRGMKGISAKNENYLRPLLSVTKEDILAFASIQKIPFREDASNQSDKYSRNAIRLHVVPELEKIKPNFVKSATTTLSLLDSQLHLYDFFIKKIEKKITSEENNFIKININLLLEYPESGTILYEILKKYHFSSAQAIEMNRALQTRHSGKYWFSDSHELILDRDFFFIRKKIENIDFKIFIHCENKIFNENGFQIQTTLLDSFNNIDKNDTSTYYLDVTKSDFPLILRKWKAGDFFLPLGMEGKRKKIQDFLTNLKLPRFEKEQVLVIETKGEIAWLVNYRADERFLAHANSAKILKINILQAN